eukprot:tig00000144_g9142.t1
MENSSARIQRTAEELAEAALDEASNVAEESHLYGIVALIEEVSLAVEEGLREDAATRIQAATLQHFARKAFLLVAQARQRGAEIIQATYRRRLAQRFYYWGRVDKYASILLQSAWRGYAGRRRRAELRMDREMRLVAARAIQAAVRRRLAARQLGPLRQLYLQGYAATLVQSAVRRRLARAERRRELEAREEELARRGASASRVQAAARTFAARRELKALRRAQQSAIALQACVRRRRALKRAHAARVLRMAAAACKIVGAARVYRARCERRLLALQKLELERWSAAAILQAAGRRAIARSFLRWLRRDAVRRQLEDAAAAIQAVFRRGRARREAVGLFRRRDVLLHAAAAVCIQSFLRMGLCRLAARVMRRSNVKYWEVVGPQLLRPATRGSAGRPFTPGSAVSFGAASSRFGSRPGTGSGAPAGLRPVRFPAGQAPPSERLALAPADAATARSGPAATQRTAASGRPDSSLPPVGAASRRGGWRATGRRPSSPASASSSCPTTPHDPIFSLSRRASALGAEGPQSPTSPGAGPAPRPATSPVQSPASLSTLARPATSPERGMRRAASGPVGPLRPPSRERPLSHARSTQSLREGPRPQNGGPYVLAAGGKVRRKAFPAPPPTAWDEEPIMRALWCPD